MKQTESGLGLFAQSSRGSPSTPWPKARGEGVERTPDWELKASVEEFSSPTEVSLFLLPLSHLLVPPVSFTQSETPGGWGGHCFGPYRSAFWGTELVEEVEGWLCRREPNMAREGEEGTSGALVSYSGLAASAALPWGAQGQRRTWAT